MFFSRTEAQGQGGGQGLSDLHIKHDTMLPDLGFLPQIILEICSRQDVNRWPETQTDG